MAEKKEQKKKNTKEKKSETILEVNEITKETLEEERKKAEELARKQKLEEERHRKEKFDKTIKKIFRGRDINVIANIIMYIFIFAVATIVNIQMLRFGFSAPTSKIFMPEKSLKELSSYNPKSISSISVDLETFDVRIKESSDDKINIRYNKKYDKKIAIKNNSGQLNIQEKNKIFKIIRFDTTNNEMIIEIPTKYEGSIEVKSSNGNLNLEKYKIVERLQENQKNQQEFYKNFFNI